MRILFVAVALCLVAACRLSPSTAPTEDADALRGDIDARPFTAGIAYAHERLRDDDIDLYVFERPIPRRLGCGSAEAALQDNERYVWVQMPWPAPVASEWWSTSNSRPPNGNNAGAFFGLRQEHATTMERITGKVEVLETAGDRGALFLDVAALDDASIRGAVKGTVEFSLCPPLD